MAYRKTKIICTLGPSTDSEDMMRQLIDAGMNVARFNFSHGSHDEHKARLKLLRKLRSEMGKPVAALLDTKGPEIRLGDFKDGSIDLEDGQTFTLTTEDILGDQDHVSITYKELPQDVKVGSNILIDDGLISMTVTDLTDTEIVCHVDNGGTVSNKKGVNVPNVELRMPFICEQDRSDIIFGVENDFDFIAASFVRTAQDVNDIREILHEKKGDAIKIIAKIESTQGVENIDEIIAAADGIMVARGDLGVEIPLEDVPVIQKLAIKKVLNAGKIVITATQMLDSMMHNPRPTRAEATDVANAIYDGTSVIMLSGETAAGEYPIEAVSTMNRIALRTEANIDYISRFNKEDSIDKTGVTSAISHATCTLSHDLNANAIVAVSKSGGTARMVSKFRPSVPIIGATLTMKVYRQLSMSWGVYPMIIDEKEDVEDLFNHVIERCKGSNILKKDDLVVMTAGVPLGISGKTNMIRVKEVD